MSPAQRRGPWVPEEDQILLQLVRTQGPNNWVRISQHMKYRSPKQCRERFHQNLKPTLNHEPISADEGAMIERMVNEMGKRWAEIARRLGNRSDNAVKNWWNGSMNRKRRGGMGSGSSLHSPRSLNGRVEPPYTKSSMNTPTHTEPNRIPFHLPKPGERWTVLSDEYRVPSSPIRLPKLLDALDCPASRESAYIDSEGRSDLHTTTIPYEQVWVKPSVSKAPIAARPKLAPIITYPTNSRPDVALISPSPSEMSNRNSVPPSMISDHNSIASVSPTTATSPLLSVPVDLHPCDDRRRGSASSAPSFSYNLVGNSDTGRAFGTVKNVDCYSDLGSHRGWEYDSQPMRPFAGSSDVTQPYHASSALSGPPADFQPQQPPTSSPRDARMGLQALLN